MEIESYEKINIEKEKLNKVVVDEEI